MATEQQLVEYLKRVAADLHDTRQRLQEVEERHAEPVAVVGVACRFPGGVSTPEQLWDLVASGRDAISGFPANRGWDLDGLYHPDPDHPGTCYTREGGFLDDADLFDAGFFGISPREALGAHPQQRVLLETSWELLERSGIAAASLRGTRTGVYVGTATTGNGAAGEGANEGYAGNAPSILSGRVAYTLGLEGPAVTVETACSSSLVAIHLASQALRQGECTLALAGGVTVMATTDVFTGFSRQRGLSPDGRCKAFSSDADGTGWGEGVGLVLLERLSDAVRNGHHVWAVIRGSAINQDGASNGMTAPNGPSQQRVIRAALTAARLSASEVDAVEAHGTGTSLGDPIEADALLATYGQKRRDDRPLWLGSIKSNIGHTQGAAGVAGVIKMIMALRHGTLPATLHVGEPTPHVDWNSGAVRLLTEPAAWPEGDHPRRAGVSSFGISGTNAHVILEQAPAPEVPEPADPPVMAPWAISARSPEALRVLAGRLADRVTAEPELSPVDVGWSLATARSPFEHRAVVLGDDPRAGVAALASGAESPDVVTGVAGEMGPGPVLVFPGQGSQWIGMGAELLESSPVFAERIAGCERALAPYVDWSLTDVLRGDGAELARVDVVQPVLWAVLVSLAAVWADQGVQPAAVIGHSQGEIAAACVAGALSIDDAARVVAVRSQVLRRLSGKGAMASIGAGEERTVQFLEHAPDVTVAAVNSPSSTVISGPPEQVEAVVAAAQEQELRARLIDVDYASHGGQVDSITDELTEALAGISPVAAEVAFYSTVTGAQQDTAGLDAEYWVTNLRRPVRFADTVAVLIEHGYRVFIESSPHPVLTPGIEECADRADVPAAVLPTLRRDQGDHVQIAHAVAAAYTAGIAIDWTRWYPADPAPRVVDLPTYPFQRQRFWLFGRSGGGDAASLGLTAAGHPLLGAEVEPAEGDTYLLTGRVSDSAASWLGDHVVHGTTLVPGSALVEWALRAADGVGCVTVEDLALRAPLALPRSGALRVQVAVGAPDATGRRDVQIYSRPADEADEEWVCHASGTLGPDAGPPVAAEEQWPPAGAEPVDAGELYERAAAAGYSYGPAFQGVRAVWRQGNDLLAEVDLPEAAGDDEGFGIHPALLDAALHPALLDGGSGDDEVWLPFAYRGVSLQAVGARAVRVRLSPDPEAEGRSVRVVLTDPAGAPVLNVDALVMRPVRADELASTGNGRVDGLYALDWVTAPQPSLADPEDVAAYPDLDALTSALDSGGTAPSTVLMGVTPADDALGTVTNVLGLVQGWLAEPRLADSRLALVTRNAVATDDVDPAAAAVWGLVRSAQSENPDRFLLIDTDDDTPDAVRHVVATGEPQVAVRDGRTLVPRLARTGADDGDRPALESEGTVLIVGGTGMAGARVAEHLVSAWGVRHLVLAGRRGPDAPGATELRESLAGLGARVRVIAVDAADPVQVAELVAGIDAAHPLTGVLHASGTLDDGVVTGQSPERLARVWAAKATVAANLHAATADLPLALFVTFSSAAGVTGNPGQAGYAAANAFCDALATRHRADGRAALSIAWGLWAEASGMTGHLDQQDLNRLRRIGMRPLASDRALTLLDAACAQPLPAVVAADFDLGGLAAGEAPVVLRALTGRVRRRAAGADARVPELAARLAGLDAAARLDAVLGVVREAVASVLGHASVDEVRAEAAFKDLGFDSLTAVELRNRLSAACGLRLPATMAFDHPTPKALARYIDGRLGGASATVARPATVTVAADEPVAIVSMACRYPGGVTSPEDLWRLVEGGVDAMGEFPADRGWNLAGLFHPDPDHPGTSYADTGAFLHDAAGFDAEFFGISPREALAMDPQQRLLLEASWETFERAGIDPASLKETATGVYAGVMYHNYATGLASGRDPNLEGYAMLSGSGSAASGRVSYTLGLQGPAVTIDTACSSSLVTIHLACQALRNGECDLALAGGVTVMATPEVFTGFSRQRGLAPDGRCKSFAASADGTGWGEGVGLVLLERLSDARRNGHHVLATVRGSAVNQDGASNGLTAPNGPSQERVIRQALAAARLTASDVDAVEAHGTGTTLGDPIEAQALLATYGQDRPQDRPLLLGSVKSNIGHTQAAAGVAGVIKMTMAMRHGTLPATLHVDEPTPHVDWSSGTVRLLTEPAPWPGTGRPRRAGVSSFGASGTNAHVILERDDPEPATADERPDGLVVPLVLSARTDAALRARAGRLVAEPDLSPVDVGWSLVTTRSTFEHRAVVVGDETAALAALAAGEPHPALVYRGGPAAGGAGPVLVFPGQGSQWAGMGAELLDSSPVFAARIAECEKALAPHVDWSLTEVLRGDGGELSRVDVVQPALWAVMVSLAALWAEYGVKPSAVIGHSQGEIAAACVAGALSIEDAARVVAVRSRVLRRLAGQGAMASIGAGEEDTARHLTGDVAVAAVNSPSSTVISGPPEQVAAVVAAAQEDGLRARLIDVDYASHGPQVDRITGELTEALAGIAPVASEVAFYSTVTAERIDTTSLDTDYWVTNLRRPVRFADTAGVLLGDGYRVFVESSPHPVLTPGIEECVDQADLSAAALATLRRDDGGLGQVAHAVAEAFTAGVDVDWTRWFAGLPPARPVDLPTYPFQHEHFWLAAQDGSGGDPAGLGLTSAGHPMLGAAIEQADADTYLLTGRLSLRTHPWLDDHRVLDTVLVPGAALVEWALRAADEAGCAAVDELVLQAPLVLPQDGGVRVQVVVDAAEADGRREVRVYSRADRDDSAWVCHANGVLAPEPAGPAEEPAGAWPPPGAEPIEIDGLYDRVAEAGYHYGPAFQGLSAAWRDGPDVLAEVTLPEAAGEPGGFGVHPALLDATLHAALLTAEPEPDRRVWLPFAWTGVALRAVDAAAVRVRLSPGEGGERDLRVQVTDAVGAPVLGIDSVVMRAIEADRLTAAVGGDTDGLFTVDWTPMPAAASDTSTADPVVLGTPADLDALVAALDAGEPAPPEVLTGVGTGEDATATTLTLVQRWLAEERLTDTRLVLVTRNAMSVEGAVDAVDPDAAAVWGLGRSAQSEHPGRFLLLDVGTGAEPDDTAVTGAARRAIDADEPQAALRGERLLVPRLVRAGASGEIVPPPAEPAWKLDTVGTATLENLRPVPCPEVLEPLAAGQVRIAVRAAGINFRDVLVSLGMAPGQVGLGSEGAGVVTGIGPDVTGFAAGDRVMGMFEGAFGPVAVADARLLAPMPEGWAYDQAAGVPVAVLTAWYGLVELAGLTAGETVLIHAATGGVGMAAVRIARHLGAEVYATASPAKHQVLEEMGIDAAHRASSRDLDFENVIRDATGGRGVDLVLNALAGEFTDASLRLVVEGGRMMDMGKTDIRDPEDVARDHPGIRYQAFDLVTGAGPDLIGEFFRTVRELFATGELEPPRVTSWPLARARRAMQLMSRARHIGKLVLTIPARPDPDGTVLITGGTGTLGAHVAEHLVTTWGIRHLVLAGRRGPDAPEAGKLAARITELGGTARIVAADVGDPDAVAALVEGIDPEHPLTGVVHAAGVLDDAVVTAQSPESLARVWSPKAAAAQHLHDATAHLPLTMFVTFSSAAATLGSPGQANYAAANAFCDALAARRQAAGLPAVSVGWGLWADASGMTGHLGETDLARMKRSGVGVLSAERALGLLDAACRHGDAHLLAIDLDVRALSARTAEETPALLRSLIGGGTTRRSAVSGRSSGELAGRLAALSRSEQHDVLLDLVRTHAAAVLGHAGADAVPAELPFKDLGFDSLTAVEVRNRLSAATGLKLPTTVVFRHPTASAVAAFLRDELCPAAADPAQPVFTELDRLENALRRLEPEGDARGRLVGRLEALLWRLGDGASADVDQVVGDGVLESASDEELFELIDRDVSS